MTIQQGHHSTIEYTVERYSVGRFTGLLMVRLVTSIIDLDGVGPLVRPLDVSTRQEVQG